MALKAFIGWTGENAAAYEVCRASMLALSSQEIEVIPLRTWDLRGSGYERWHSVSGSGQRVDGVDGSLFSTDFSFSRFMVPSLADYADEWVLYCDSDMLFLDDPALLWTMAWDRSGAIGCVQHGDMIGGSDSKIAGSVQTFYRCKNWSSLMMMQAKRCAFLDPRYVSTASGKDLHQFAWIDQDQIASIPRRWNVLHGIQFVPDPAVVHFTLGTPDLPLHAPDDRWSEMWWSVLRLLESSKDSAIPHIKRAIESVR